MTVNTHYIVHTTHSGLSLIIVNIPKNNDCTTTYSNTKLRIKDEVSILWSSTNGNILLQRDNVLLERVTHMYATFLLSSIPLSSMLALGIMTSYMDSREPDSVALLVSSFFLSDKDVEAACSETTGDFFFAPFFVTFSLR